jgi:hypothetical protein
MVTGTTNQRLWRVELDTIHDDHSKSGIVCYVHINSSGMQVYYSHHCMYSRTIAKGPWSAGTVIRQPLNAGLKAIIAAGLITTISSLAFQSIQTWAGEPGRPIEEVDLDV